MGLTADNVRIVRFTNWVEEGNLKARLLKGVLLFFLLCILFGVWQFIVIYILVIELYYLYKFPSKQFDYRQSNSDSNEVSNPENSKRRNYKRRQSNAKLDMNKEFAQSSSMLLRVIEMSTESTLMLIVQLYIAIYNDFTPGPLNCFSMLTSFVSIVFGTL